MSTPSHPAAQHALFLLLVLPFAACAHGPTVEGPPTIGLATEDEPLPARPEGIEGPPAEWSAMSGDQRREYMSAHVVPTMGPLFRAFDAERFETFECGTCHGPRAAFGAFDMPSAALPVLPAPDSEAWRAMRTERAHVFRFMAERVEPVMAELLGKRPFNPRTGEGFGCFDCHTQESD